MLVLAIAAFWLLTSTAVLITTDPAAARIEIAGAPEIRLGGRFLLRPGRYAVTARAEGYAEASMAITVSDEASQDFRLRLQRLPGLVAVVTRPAVAATVSLDGRPVGRTPLADLPVPAGVHRLAVAAPRFKPWELTLTVEGGGARQAIDAELVPDWAAVAVSTIPAGAAALVDGVSAGTTPVTLELLAGNHTLTLEKDGFKTLTRQVSAVANQPQSLAGLTLVPADGLVRVISEPPGAAVSVGGRYRGVTPLETELAPGQTYAVMLSKPGYEPATAPVDLTGTRGATVRVTLTPRIGIIKVVSEPADAELFVDGKAMGSATTELSLPAVRHRLEVRKAGFATFRTEVTPEPDLPRVVEVRLLSPEEAVAASVAPQTTASGMELRLIQPGKLRLGAPRPGAGPARERDRAGCAPDPALLSRRARGHRTPSSVPSVPPGTRRARRSLRYWPGAITRP